MSRYLTAITFLLLFQITALPQQYITVTFPNGGEVLCSGVDHVITWDSNVPGTVEIQLFKSGVFLSSITTSTPNDREYTWNFSNGPEQSDFLIKILSVVNSNIFDLSDSTFTIGGCSINLISPNGYEVWYVETTQRILWNQNFVSDVEIQLFMANVFQASFTAPGTGEFDWFIPESIPARAEYRVKLKSILYEDIYDISDTVFTITNLTAVDESFNGIPESFQLMQNYPNPFNPGTTIYYGLPEAGNIKLVIYDVLGNEVINYKDSQTAGYHNYEFDGSDLNSGVYFYRLQAGDPSANSKRSFVETKKMILIK
jgi:Secretion system C-terminal sorting domain